MSQRVAVEHAFTRRALIAQGTRIGVVHVPKTAGTSVGAALGHHGLWRARREYLELPPEFDTTGWDDQMLAALATPESLTAYFHASPVIVGHFSARSFLSTGARDLVMTVREPRARLLSLFRWVQSPSFSALEGLGAHLMRTSAAHGLADFLDQAPARTFVDNSIASYLVASPGEDVRSLDIEARMSEALVALRGAFWVDEGTQLLNCIGRLTCTPMGHDDVPRLNVTSRHDVDTTELLTQRDLAALDHYTECDRIVLGQLMSAGLLTQRTSDDLRAEFETAVAHHGFRLVGAAPEDSSCAT